MAKREASEQDANSVSSTGSFVGKHANFCATVLAWQINVKRVVCTGSHSAGRQDNHQRNRGWSGNCAVKQEAPSKSTGWPEV
ncbi:MULTISPECIES: hypothetical protein [Pseudomonas]|uniref:hypothetical protein n=1 Tax=Pseudomonas TaxID=286 RepID=UPI001D05D8A1|nr:MULTISPECIES: hypothetical protein [Pseudomonas]UIN57624.1 hypothetical protein LXN51_19870 [Pseudomonas kribbensis]